MIGSVLAAIVREFASAIGWRDSWGRAIPEGQRHAGQNTGPRASRVGWVGAVIRGLAAISECACSHPRAPLARRCAVGCTAWGDPHCLVTAPDRHPCRAWYVSCLGHGNLIPGEGQAMAHATDVDQAKLLCPLTLKRGRLDAFVVQARTRSEDSRSRRSERQVCYRACATRFGMPLAGGRWGGELCTRL